jgi:NAD(P)-dependent dehydrogenase (short-subunit alcohol dehydrogenase family)
VQKLLIALVLSLFVSACSLPAVIVGAGQSPGEGMGNGRATTFRFAQEGARILAVDRLIASAEETAAMAAVNRHPTRTLPHSDLSL